MSIRELSGTVKAILYLGSLLVAAFVGGLTAGPILSRYWAAPDNIERLSARVERLEQVNAIEFGQDIRISHRDGSDTYYLVTEGYKNNLGNAVTQRGGVRIWRIEKN